MLERRRKRGENDEILDNEKERGRRLRFRENFRANGKRSERVQRVDRVRISVGSARSDKFFSNFALNPPVYVSFADRESGLIISNAKQSVVTEPRGEWKGMGLKREERCERRELRKSATCLANSPLFSKRLSFQPNEQILRDSHSLRVFSFVSRLPTNRTRRAFAWKGIPLLAGCSLFLF